jgi:hypothetical protein
MIRDFALFLLFGFVTMCPGFAQAIHAAQAAEAAPQGADHLSSNPVPAAGKEDWSKLPVDRKVMPLLVSGVSMGKTETSTYTRELIRLQWRLQDALDIWVVIPRSVKKPRAVLYLYSFPSDIDRFNNDSWCMGATHDGLAAIGFISALTGERFRGRPMREWFLPELQESLGTTTHDVQLIIDYLERRGDLNVDKVGMFGQGSGGTIAILAAAVDPRIRAIDLLNPWGDWPDWLKSSPLISDSDREKYLTPEFLQKAATVEPITYLPLLKDRALRVQQIMDYPHTPPAARDKIAEAVLRAELVQYKDRTAHAEAWKTAGLSGWLAHQLESESGSRTENAGKSAAVQQ